MAAAYVFCHPFLDGNKRMGLIVSLLFLAYNGATLNVGQQELYEMIMQIAESKVSEKEIALFFKNKASYNASKHGEKGDELTP